MLRKIYSCNFAKQQSQMYVYICVVAHEKLKCFDRMRLNFSMCGTRNVLFTLINFVMLLIFHF